MEEGIIFPFPSLLIELTHLLSPCPWTVIYITGYPGSLVLDSHGNLHPIGSIFLENPD